MKLSTQPNAGLNLVTAYGDDHIAVNGVAQKSSFILTADSLRAPWSVGSSATLSAADIAQIEAVPGAVVLLGTGRRQRFPAPAVLRPLQERGIGVEVMDSIAACRTYNILVGEGRPVIAAIILETAA